MRRSEPSAMAIRLRTSLDGGASPRSISQRWAALTSDARARRRSPIPASTLPADVGSNRAVLLSGDGRRAAVDLGSSHAGKSARAPLSGAYLGPLKPQGHRSVRPSETLGTTDSPPARQGAS